MMQLLKSERIKLTTVTSHWVLWLVAIVFPFVITVLVGLLSSDPRFTDTIDLIDLVSGTSVVAALLIGVVGTLSITGEFAHNTIRPTLVATPSRLRVWAAKALLIAVVGAVLGAVIWLGNFLVGAAILNGRGADISFGDEPVSAVLGGVPIYFALVSLFGFGLGSIFRSSPAAISTLVLWPLLVEGIITLVLTVAQVDDAEQYLPYTAGTALIASEPELTTDLGRIGGGLYLAVFVAVVVVVGVVVNRRRDV